MLEDIRLSEFTVESFDMVVFPKDLRISGTVERIADFYSPEFCHSNRRNQAASTRYFHEPGSVSKKHTPFLVIAATHQDLETMVATGSFRRDLFYRLNVFPILIPPLRDRKKDFALLLQHFIKKGCEEIGRHPVPSPTPNALERLRAYDWPGNVRELEHIVRRTLIIDQNIILNFAEFALKTAPLLPTDPSVSADEDLKLDKAITRQIYLAMAKAKGRVEGVNGAARLLDIKPGKLRYQMKRLGIPYGRKQTSPK